MLIRENKNSNLLMWFLTSSSYEIEITSEVTGRAPTPELTIGVKQSGKKQRNSLQLLIIFYYNAVFCRRGYIC